VPLICRSCGLFFWFCCFGVALKAMASQVFEDFCRNTIDKRVKVDMNCTKHLHKFVFDQTPKTSRITVLWCH